MQINAKTHRETQIVFYELRTTMIADQLEMRRTGRK